MCKFSSLFSSPRSPRGCTSRAGSKSFSFGSKNIFKASLDQYEAKNAIIYGRFRCGRFTEVVEKFVRCGDSPGDHAVLATSLGPLKGWISRLEYST